jgi:hypothetical protein
MGVQRLVTWKKYCDNKWVFKKKLVDGNIKKLHAQLVARGFEQAQGMIYRKRSLQLSNG